MKISAGNLLYEISVRWNTTTYSIHMPNGNASIFLGVFSLQKNGRIAEGFKMFFIIRSIRMLLVFVYCCQQHYFYTDCSHLFRVCLFCFILIYYYAVFPFYSYFLQMLKVKKSCLYNYNIIQILTLPYISCWCFCDCTEGRIVTTLECHIAI